jgi:hypothetical protein
MLDVEPEKTKTLNDINNKRIANNSTMMWIIFIFY